MAMDADLYNGKVASIEKRMEKEDQSSTYYLYEKTCISNRAIVQYY